MDCIYLTACIESDLSRQPESNAAVEAAVQRVRAV